MIQTQTILKVADNSGAKTVKCIGFIDTKKKNNVNIGDCIIVSVRSLTSRKSSNVKINTASSKKSGSSLKLSSSKSTIKKGQIFKALIIRTKKGILNRKYGHTLSFNSNDVILLNTQGNLVGSRIFGPITRELRAKNFLRVLSNAERIL
jgi:large subunit ribosomal protein L14